MLKAIIIGCAMCAGASATTYWVTSSDNAAAQSTANPKMMPTVANSNMQSVIQELHSIQVIIDPN